MKAPVLDLPSKKGEKFAPVEIAAIAHILAWPLRQIGAMSLSLSKRTRIGLTQPAE